MSKITDLLKTKRPQEELAIALSVLQEFKSNENQEEWLACPFVAWAKLEQLEEYLEYLVNGKALESDTIEYINKPGPTKEKGE